MSDIFQKLLARVPKDTAQFVDQSMDITLTIKDLLRKKGLTQKDLAQKLGKSEAEISKWLTTGYNLTLKSIAKIEVALEEQIIIPAKFVEEYEGSYKVIPKSLKLHDFKKLEKEEMLLSRLFESGSFGIPNMNDRNDNYKTTIQIKRHNQIEA
jgi:transcriptional regulator with XRE-family HTH domain